MDLVKNVKVSGETLAPALLLPSCVIWHKFGTSLSTTAECGNTYFGGMVVNEMTHAKVDPQIA